MRRDVGLDTCPYCDFELNRPAHRRVRRGATEGGGKSPGQELVSCPDCGGVIDGFSSH